MEQESSSVMLVKPTLEELEERIKEKNKKRKNLDKEYAQLLTERDRLKRDKTIRGLFDRILGYFRLCRKTEMEILKTKLAKLEEEYKNEKTHHAAELKRLRMNMSSIEQQREGLKDISANWKEIQTRWKDYETHIGPDKLSLIIKGKMIISSVNTNQK